MTFRISKPHGKMFQHLKPHPYTTGFSFQGTQKYKYGGFPKLGVPLKGGYRGYIIGTI